MESATPMTPNRATLERDFLASRRCTAAWSSRTSTGGKMINSLLARSHPRRDFSRGGRLNFDAVCLNLVVQSLTADAEAFGGFEFVAAGFLEHLNDGVAFNALEEGEISVLGFVADGARFADGKIGGVDFFAFGEKDRALDFVLKLTNVAGPIEGSEAFDGGGRIAFDGPVG